MQLLTARKGSVEIVEAPDPVPAEHEVLIQTVFSAVSTGTEMAAVSGQSVSFFSLLRRGIHSWDKVRRSLARRGLKQTLAKVEAAVENPLTLGYSLTGRVVGLGRGVEDFQVGDWVVAVGPHASHATFVTVPRLMCAPLSKPEWAIDASTAALACVGIHALHRAQLSAGSEVAVFGLGLIGQFTVQALRAIGCRVIAFDPIESRRNDAAQAGAETYDPLGFDFEEAERIASHGEGLDSVFLCAKTDAPDLLRKATALCRKRAKLVVVGEFPISLPRELAYGKEIELCVSAAYGDGRYDPAYEQLDQDYPLAQARWTVRRNLDLFLRWLDEGRMSVSSFRPQIHPFDNAPEVYRQLASSPTLLTVFQYPEQKLPHLTLELSPRSVTRAAAIPLAVVGLGRFATEIHLPHLAQAADKFEIHTLVGRRPAKIAALARKFHANRATSDLQEALGDSSVAAVLIATPHNTHADQVIASLEARKHVYVEKPLCISVDELDRIEATLQKAQETPTFTPVLFVGFNRRFAPVSYKLFEERIKGHQPLDIHYEFHAPPLPRGDWYDRPEQGGRFIGEVCHAIDWILWLAGSPLQDVMPVVSPNGADVFFRFEDSSRAHLHFKKVAQLRGPKERVTVTWGPTEWVIEDFAHLKIFNADRLKHKEAWKSKGHREALDAFAGAIAQNKTGDDPFRFLASMHLTLELDRALRS